MKTRAQPASAAEDLRSHDRTWSPAGTAVYPRLYHSSALLLPDATVWVAGSNPKDVWEEHMEIYSPAYLFTTDGQGNTIPAVRPTITSLPDEVGYGAPLQIKPPDSANIRDIVMMRAKGESLAAKGEVEGRGETISRQFPPFRRRED